MKYIDPSGHIVSTLFGAIFGGIVGGVTAFVEGTDIMSGVAGGAISGGLVGLAIDVTFFSGGSAAVVIGAAAGGLGSGIGDYVNQVGNNLSMGKDLEESLKDYKLDSILISAGIGVASGALGGATAKAMEAWQKGTQTYIKQIASRLVKETDNEALVPGIRTAHTVAVKTGNTMNYVDFYTSTVYNASQNTLSYYLNDQLVTSFKLDLKLPKLPLYKRKE